MIDLSKYSVEVKGFRGKYKGDLIAHEGPLLSHFELDGNHFLYKWCDANNIANRWLVVKVDKKELMLLFESHISLYNILSNHDVIFQDIDTNNIVIAEYNVPVLEIPDEYLPFENSFYDESFYEKYAQELYKSLITN